MIGKQNENVNFFDSYIFDNLLPEKHILLDIKKEINFSFVEEELKDLYDTKNGRPAYPPEVLFKMLFLEFYYNLSDVEVVKQCQVNILYRYFIDLSIDQKIPDDTTLVVFRKRCGSERFERLFNRIIETCNEKGLLREKLKIVDATVIEGDVSVPNRVNLLRKGRNIVVKKIANIDREEREVLSHYVNEKRLRGRPSPQEVNEEISKTEEFINEVKEKYGEDVEDILNILEELCTHKDDQANSQEKHIVSFTDTDVRFGAKSDKKKFVGYKAHICMNESGIVTSVDILHGNEKKVWIYQNCLRKNKQKE